MGPWYDHAFIWHRDYVPPEPPEGPDPLIAALLALARQVAALWTRAVGKRHPRQPKGRASAPVRS
jgi:hypothetical protein